MSNQNPLKSTIPDQNNDSDHFSTLSRSQQKNIERRGHRALYDLPPRLIKRIASIAEEYSLTNSQVAGVLLLYALKEFNSGKVKIRDYRQTSESPRYTYKIDLVKLLDKWYL